MIALIPQFLQHLPSLLHMDGFHQNIKISCMPKGYIAIKLECQEGSFKGKNGDPYCWLKTLAIRKSSPSKAKALHKLPIKCCWIFSPK